MIILTNTASQTLAPGQSLTFNTVFLHTGCAECHRPNTGSVILRQQQAIYNVHFSANIGASVPGPAQLAIDINGSPLIETTMVSTTAASGDLNNVAKNTAVRTCCCGPETVTVTNTGTAEVVVESPTLFIRRQA